MSLSDFKSFIIHSALYGLTCLLLSFIFLTATSSKNTTIASDFDKTFSQHENYNQGLKVKNPFFMKTQTSAYLAARFAKNNKQWDAASEFYEQVLSFSDHEKSINSHEEKTAFLVAITSGNFDFAYKLSQKESAEEEFRALQKTILTLHHLKNSNYKAAEETVSFLPNEGVHLYFKSIALAWLNAQKIKPVGAKAALSNLPRIRSDIKNPLEDITYGMTLDYLNDSEQARSVYKDALSQHMTLASALNVANFFERHGDNATAKKLYEDIFLMRPNHDLSHRKINALNKANQTSLTIEPRIQSLNEGLGYSLLNLATFLFEQNSEETALVYAQMALEIAPTIDESWILVGDILSRLGQDKTAIRYYQHLAFKENAVNSTNAGLKLADLYHTLGQNGKTLEVLEHAQKQWPTNKDILLSKANFQQQYNEAETALELYKRIEESHSDNLKNDWKFYFSRALTFHELGQLDKAEKDLQQALKASPSNPVLLNHLGYLWASQGKKLDEAYSMIDHALLFEPNNGYFLDSMGVVLYQQKRFEEAIKMFESAIKEIPFHTDVLENLGDAYWQVGRYQEARYQWRKAQDKTRSSKLIDALNSKIENGLSEAHKIGLRAEQ